MSGNCNNAFCNFAANIERGCNCFNNIDDDGDGKIDKADPNCATYYGLTFVGEGSDCNLPVPNTGLFTGMSFSGASSQNTADTQAKVTVGDVDGDGAPDAVITSKFARKLSVVATWGTQADGSKVGDAKATIDATNVSWFNHGTGACDPAQTKPTFEHELAIADIDPTPTDKRAEIFAIVGLRPNSANNPVPNCYYLVGMRYNAGNGNIALLPGWGGRAASIGVNRPGAHGVADMDGDGKAEVYLRDRIYAAETGALLATGNGDWDLDVTSGPVAADVIKGDNGKMELVVGTLIYSIPNLTNRNPAAPAVMVPTKKMNDLLAAADRCFVKLATDPTEYGVDTHSMCSIADIDRDGNIDVIISGALGSVTGKTTIFYWNVALNTVTRYVVPDAVYPNGWPWGTGRVNIGDADGDGSPNLSFVAGTNLTVLKVGAGGALSPLWTRTINDSKSGVITVTIYDFDSDGKPELVYRDSQELAVVDGTTGATKLWSATCQSHTYTEGPIIADVNGDGLTDICVTCNTSNSFNINDPLQQQALGQIRLWNNSGGTTWAPTRKIWNQQPYFVVNINDDMTLPFPMVDQNIVFSGGSCATGIVGPLMRMNVFLNQIPFLTSSGCPIMPAPDLTFSPVTLPDNSVIPAVEVISPICGDRTVQVRFNIKNIGDLPITDNIPVSFFNGDPTLAGATLLHATSIAVTNLQIDSTFRSSYISFNGPGPTFQLYVVLNNNGSVLPINPAGSVTNECRIDNNIYPITVTPSPFTVQVVKVKDNFTCNNTPPNNGELRVKIFKGATEVLDYSQYTFQWNTGPITGFTPIAGATNYNLTALDEGTYTVVVTNTLGQCSALPVEGTIVETGNDPAVSITVVSHQTQCNPENGKLVASIVGGDVGFTYEWFDIALTPLGINGNTADGLSAGNYLVRVSKDGCSKLSLPVTVEPPAIPDAQATTLRDVVNCSFLSDGKVTARAVINGVPIPDADTTLYKFQWFFYNNATSTQGSVIPVGTETNPSRPGLAAGFYMVEVTNIATQCKSNMRPFTEVKNSTVLPTAQITRLTAQTSCDPNNPNASLAGDALVAGVIQDPALYTFEWFRGQNTLPGNLHVTTSGVNGRIATLVKGGGLSYTVRVKNIANNCFATTDLPADELLIQPVVTVTTDPNGICDPALAGGTAFTGRVISSVTFNGVAVADFTNYRFDWHDGSLVTDPAIAVADSKNPILSNLDDGSYTVTATRTDLFCTSAPQTGVVIDAVTLPVITSSAVPSTNCDPALANGEARVTNVDGAGTGAPYTFQWHTGLTPTAPIASATNASLLNRQGGVGSNFTVLVTKTTTGCQNTATVQVPDASVLPLLSLTPTPNGICDPALTSPAAVFSGSVAATITNQVGVATDYAFTWRNGQLITSPVNPASSTGTLGTLNGGFYTTTVKHNPTGCVSDPFTAQVINNTVLPAITSSATPSTSCDPALANGLAQVTDVDGAGIGLPFIYQWHTGIDTSTPIATATTAVLANRQGGPAQNFTVKVTKQTTGCVNTATILIPDASVLPVLTLTPAPNGICNPALTSPAVTFGGSVNAAITNQIGVVGDYVFTWRDGQLVSSPVNNSSVTGSIINLNSGFYTTTVKHNPTGCVSDPFTAQVLNTTVLPSLITNAVASTNCDPALANGQAQITDVDGVGTGAPYIFQWHTGIDTSTPIPTATNPVLLNRQGGAAQNFTVLVTKQTTGCQSTATVQVPDASVLPTLSLVPAPNGICNPALTSPAVNFSGNITATITNQIGVVGDYAFTWRDGQLVTSPLNNTSTSGSIVNLSSGFYTTTVRHNPTGCVSDPSTAQVLDITVLPAVTTNAVPSTNCDPALANGQAQVTDVDGAGTGAPFIFQWHTGGDVSAPIASATAATLINRQGGAGQNFTVLVTKQTTGCQNTRTVLIPDASVLPLLTLTPVGNDICDPALTSPASPFTGSMNAAITNQIGVVGDYVFTWRNGELVTDPVNPASTSGALINLNTGFYTTTVRHTPTGCVSDPATALVPDNTTLPIITTSAVPSTNCDPALANGQALVTDVDGIGTGSPFVFQWHTGVDTSTPVVGATNPALLNRQGGAGQNFTVLVTKQTTGCRQSNTVMVADARVLPLLSLVPVPNTVCDPALTVPSVAFNGSVTSTITNQIGVIGDYVYTWHNGPLVTDAINPTSSTAALTNLNSGFYTTTVIHTPTGCVSDPFSSQVEDNTVLPMITTNALPSTNCDPALANGQAIVTDVDGLGTAAPYVFQWHTGTDTSTPIATATGATLSNRQGGAGQNFTALVTRQTTGCQSSATVLVPDAKQLPIITLSATQNTICNGTPDGTATLATLTYQGNPVASPFTGYTFLWSTTATTPAIGSLAQNTYSLAVTRTDVGCTSDVVFVDVINNFFIPPIDVALINQTSCNTLAPNGMLTATVDETTIGGTNGINAGYNFDWFNGVGTGGVAVTTTTAVNGQVNTLPGNLSYTVEVRRITTGCTNTETMFLPEIITYPIVVAAVSSNVSRCDLPDGSIQADVGGVQAGYTFFWLNEDDQNQTTDAAFVVANADATTVNNGNYPNLIPGYYTVAVRDNTTFCISQPVTEEVDDVSIKSIINITLGPVLPSTCGVADGQMTAMVTGGVGPFDLFWHNGGPDNADIDFFTNPPQFTPPNDVPFNSALATTTSSLLSLESKLYTLIVKDQGNGCGNYETVFLPFTDSHDIDETLTPSSICPYTIGNGEIEVEVINIPAVPAGLTFGDFSYALYSGENPLAANQIGARIGPGAPPVINPMLYSALAPGKYTIEVKQEFSGGCPVYKVVEIESDALPPVISLVGALTSNTACDLTSADGAATINISKDPNDVTVGSTYTLGVSPAPATPPAYPIAGLGTGNQNIINLRPASDVPVYTVTVTSSNNCVAERFLSIPDQPQVSEMVSGNVTITDAQLCNPSGSVVVNTIDVINGTADPDFTNLANYTFNWYNNASLTGPVIHTGVGLTPNGERLNTTTFPTIGPGSYWVESVKTGGTKGIGCTSAPFKADIEDVSEDPTFTLQPFSNTACDANFEGRLLLTVTDPGSAATANYTYDWDATNPFDIEGGTGPVTANNDGVGTDDNPTTLPDGLYKVTVTNIASGCSTSGQASILKTEAPILVALATPVDQMICNPDGSITVNEVRVDGVADVNHANFDFTWFAGSTASVPVVSAVNNADVLNITNLPTIGAGAYFVKAKRIGGVAPGSGCESAPVRVEIEDQSRNPLFALTPFDNTACDANFEGSMLIDVTDPGSAPTATYTYTWDATNPVGLGVVAANDDGAGADDHPTDLPDGTYKIVVTNDVSGCSTAGQASIVKTATPILVALATPVDQMICDPDGSITVNEVRVDGIADVNHANFDFTWFVGSTASVPVINAVNNADVLNVTNLPTIGAGSYFVKARRLAGVNIGSGCESAPLRVEINDLSSKPVFALTPFSNTACDANFEGSLLLDVTDPGSAPTATYTYTWDATNPVAFGTVIGNDDGLGTDENPTSLPDGTYKLTVTNDVTGCVTPGQATILKTATPILVALATPLDQLICNPDGSITVTEVRVNGVADANHANFDFTWFAGSTASVPVINAVNNVDVLDISNLPTIGAGSYFVKAKRVAGVSIGSGCESAPLRVDIQDLSRNPLFTLSPFSNTACDANFEGSLLLDVTDPGSAPTATYTYKWDATNPVAFGTVAGNDDGIGADENPTGLPDGTYKLTVTNDASGCITPGQATILKTETPILVALATPIDQMICNPDGTITVNEVRVDGIADGNHANFDFTWFVGSTASVPVINEVNNADVLNITNLPTIGEGSYFVKAKRVPGVGIGSGCESAPLRVEIQDLSRNPLFTLSPFSNTACDANFEGSLLLDVTDAGSAPTATYTYTWDATNPVAFGTVVGNNDGLGVDENPVALPDGTYKLTVTNDASGCITPGQATILKSETPIVVALATPVNQLLCDPDGSITVNEVRVDGIADANHANFNFTWFVGSATSVPVINEVNNADVLNTANLPTIGAGSYFVKAKRVAGVSIGSGCESAPLRVEIQDLSRNPLFTLTPFSNTACDANFEGSLLLDVTDPGAVPSATYTYTWDPANPVAFGTVVGNDDGAGADENPTALPDGTYNVTVKNDVSGCITPGQATIQRIETPILVALAAPVDQMICNPDGSITVTEVRVDGIVDVNHANFDFTWFVDSPANAPVINEVNNADVLNITNLPSIGAGTYFVKAKRAVGTGIGSGCESAPLRVDLQDLSVDPDMSFVSVPNSSCNNLNPNAQITATAIERDGTTDNYTFAWLLDGNAIALPTTQTDLTPTSQLMQAFNGNYALEVLNTLTGCRFTKSIVIELDQTMSFPNILSTTEIDPINCFPTGSSEVVSVSIGGQPPIAGNDPRFAYDWFEAANFPTTPIAGQSAATLPNQLPGNYFVIVRDVTTDCPSAPTEVVIDDAVIVYPDIDIVQTIKQLMCDGTGSAELQASADGGNTGGTYSFTWFGTLDGTGTPIPGGTTATLSNLIQGNYSVTVFNAATNCKATDLYIIEDESPDYYPQLVLTGFPRQNCLTPDGSLVAQEVAFETFADYPFASNYTAHRYDGAKETVDVLTPGGGTLLTSMPGFPRHWEEGGLTENLFYTIKIVDNNTQCIVFDDVQIQPGMVDPVVDVMLDNPLVNCDESIANGQLDATADGGQISGYTFEWFAGNSVAGTALTGNTSGNKLIGVGAVHSPTLEFTVRVTNDATQCDAEATAQLTDGRLPAPTPTTELIQHDTRCDSDDGWVTANVSGQVLGYLFSWDNAAAQVDPNLMNLAKGTYNVVAIDAITGCKSLAVPVLVDDLSVIPDLIFKTTASFCKDVFLNQGLDGSKGSGTIELQLDPADLVSDNAKWISLETGTQVGNGNYITELLPGEYQVDVITSKGCPATGKTKINSEILSYNLVTRNNDGKNDNFFIDCMSLFPKNNVKIFNRSGVLVYEANGYNNDDVVFDGFGKTGIYAAGNDLPVGTYFYIIDKGDGSKPRSGYLELVK